MGLLSDPEYASAKWAIKLYQIHIHVCWLCYFFGVAWLFLVAYNDFNNETYFSENALLPGLVTNEFNAEHSAKLFHNEFLRELEDKYSDTDEMPVPWLVGKMSQLHLEVYTHNFTLKYPLGLGQKFHGTNVYGILRAPRTPSLEALVVTAPYRSLRSHHKGTTAGIALMLAFAQFARPQKYWAKDIIFLVTEHEQLGMQAWLEAYHGLHSDSETFYKTLGSFWKPDQMAVDFDMLIESMGMKSNHQKCLDPGKLKGRSGSIQAAINLEFHDPKIKYIEVKVEGLNGQLPNLDLVNLVHKLCVKSGIHHSYKESYSWIRGRGKMDQYLDNVKNMVAMIFSQLAGVPNGNHGLFHRFGIEAVTLEGRDANDPGFDGVPPPRVTTLTSTNFYRLGIALESIFRSLNNLLERFHQSYFFYMLPASNRFVSIGQYMPTLCLFCLALLIKALSLWVVMQPREENDNTKRPKCNRCTESEEEKKNEHDEWCPIHKRGNESRLKSWNFIHYWVFGLRRCQSDSVLNEGSGHSEDVKTDELDPADNEISMNLVNIAAPYLILHLWGYVVMKSPVVLCWIGAEYFELPSDVSLFIGLTTIMAFSLWATPFLPNILCPYTIIFEEFALLSIIALIELTTLLLCVGMQNFSSGVAIAILYVPVALLTSILLKVEEYDWKSVEGKKRKIFTVLKRLTLFFLNPLLILVICLVFYANNQYPEESWWDAITRGVNATIKSIMFAVADSLIYGNWLFNVVCTVLFPVCLIFWMIVWNKAL